MRAPTAIAVIGGVITSTFLTLLVVPVVYVWVDRFTLRGRRALRRGEAAQGDVVDGSSPVALAKPPVAEDGVGASS
jgi:hypothetical protein